MRFGLLGPVQAGNDRHLLEVKGTVRRALLAALLIRPGTVVSIDRLSEVIWGPKEPASPSAALYNQVTRLRQSLGEDGERRIKAVSPGYLIRVEAGELDVHEFEDRCDEARRAALEGRWKDASNHYADALSLWRGRPLADVPALAAHPFVQHLEEARLLALQERTDAALNLGRHDDVIGELRALVAEHPLREAFHGQLMLALHRAGRQAEALGTFADLREIMVDEVGDEPSAAIRDLHSRILRADPTLALDEPARDRARQGTDPVAATPEAPASAAGRAVFDGLVQHQLPADTRVFTGRAREVRELLGLVEGAGGAVVISAIEGMAGIGKTTLAVHAAHVLSDRFPDGQLFLDLRGYTAGVQPLTSAEALGRLLRSLGVPQLQIPEDVDERAALLRSRLAGKKALIVLDNAAGSDQVRPLLPGRPGCLVLVTSRRALHDLDDVHTLSLAPLANDEAVELLRQIAGADRVPDGSDEGELAAVTGNLPLAIRIIGARLRRVEGRPAPDALRRLRDRLVSAAPNQGDDRNLRDIFDLSYTAVPETARRLFRCLSQVPGPDFDVYAVANLLATDTGTAQELLGTLFDHSLLNQPTLGRYHMHDLVRDYARARFAEDEAQSDADAVARLMAYYLSAAIAADRFIALGSRPAAHLAEPAAHTTPRFSGLTAALAWMAEERLNIEACITDARRRGWPRLVVRLTGALAGELQHSGPTSEAVALYRAAIDAARAAHDELERANLIADLGRTYRLTGDLAGATRARDESLSLYRALGSRLGEANSHLDLGRILYAAADLPAALAAHRDAHALYLVEEDRLGQANAAFDLGSTLVAMRDYGEANELLDMALAMYRELGSLRGEGNVLVERGRYACVTGSPRAALADFTGAVEIFREIRSHVGASNVLLELGDVYYRLGDYRRSFETLQECRKICHDYGMLSAEALATGCLGRSRAALGDVGRALADIEGALLLSRRAHRRFTDAILLRLLGRVQHQAGESAPALTHLEMAVSVFRDIGDHQSEAEAVNDIATVKLDTGCHEEAWAMFEQALKISRDVECPEEEAIALDGTARCKALAGDLAGAVDDLRGAIAVFAGIESPARETSARRLADIEGRLRRSARG